MHFSPEQIALINLVTTIVLCLITTVYVYVTYRIQSDQRRHFQLTNRPYLAYENFEMGLIKDNNDIKSLQPKLFFKNVGNVLLEFNVDKIEYTINNIANTSIINFSGYIYPKMNTISYCPTEMKFNKSNLKKENEVVLKYKVSYRIPGTKKTYISEKTLLFKFDPTNEKPFGILFRDQIET